MFWGAPNVSLNKFTTQFIWFCVYYVYRENNMITVIINYT